MAHISLHTHFVFSTKERAPQITEQWRERLYAYIGGIVRNADCRLIDAGGMSDHIHLLIGMHQSIAPADLMRLVKSNSSGWVHEDIKAPFEWQKKYGAFSVSKSGLDAVIHYINTQEEHHRTMTFQEEYLELLKRHEIDYDPRYVFECSDYCGRPVISTPKPRHEIPAFKPERPHAFKPRSGTTHLSRGAAASR